MLLFDKLKAALEKQTLTKNETNIVKGGHQDNSCNEDTYYDYYKDKSHGHPPPFDEF